MNTRFELSDLERGEILEALYTALAEVSQTADISQGVVDRLHEAVEILGGHYESIS